MSEWAFIFADLIIGVVMLAVINALGAKGLPLTYRSFINAFDEEKSIFNVGYRIFAPIVLLMIIALIGKVAAPEIDSFLAFYSIIFLLGTTLRDVAL